MAKGKWKRTLLGIQGLVGHRSAPDWSFLYEASLIKSPNWEIGDHVVLPDGREFVYAKSIGACVSGQGCEFTATGAIYGYPIATVAKGGKVVTLGDSGSATVLTHAAAFAKDVFRGGYYLSHDHPVGDSDAQVRGIVGNDYSAINAVLVLYLDAQLHKAVSTDEFTEIFENPYAALRTGTSSSLAKAGVPAVEVAATLTYFWVQISGPCFIAPQGTVIDNQTGCYWRNDGSLQDAATAYDVNTGTGAIGSQYAGHRLLGDYAGYGPLFMLRG